MFERKIIIENDLAYKIFFENSPSGICITQVSGKMKVNPAFCQMLGYSEDDFPSVHWDHLTHHDDVEKCKSVFNDLTNGCANSLSLEKRYITKSRNLIWVNESITIHKDEKDKPLFFVCTATDITESKKAVDRFVKSDEDFKTFFDNNLSGNFITTEEGQILLSNKRFREIFGFESEEHALNTNIISIYKNPEERKFLLEKILKEKRLENYEMEMLKLDGRTVHVLVNILGRFKTNGELDGLLGYLNDVSEQKLVNEKINHLSVAVEQSPASILITDVEGNIQYVNPKCVEITGYSKEDLIGKNPKVLKSGETSEIEYRELWKTIKAGGEWRGEFHNKKKNGELYWEFASISPIKNEKGEVTNFLAVKEDITDRKKSEQELILAKEKAEEINRVKSNFFSNMSHELRTPLSGILGFTELLQEEIKNPEHKRMLDGVHLSGQRLLDTLNKILQISKIESEKLNPKIERIYLPFLIQSLVSEFEATMMTKGLFIKLDYENDNLFADLDKDLFRTILNNLLSNAIKFTPSGGIIIHCKNVIENGTNRIVLKVSDSGIGISHKDQEVIFEEFRQASEGLNRLYEGTGLGLTIVKRYTEIMGGTVSVKSEPGNGTTFTLSFAGLTKGQMEADTENTAVSEKFPEDNKENMLHKSLVLLVEDDMLNSEMVEVFLHDYCKLHIARSGEEALERITKYKYDAFLMDIALGSGMSGLQTSNVIRSTPGYEGVPIIAVTAYAMSGEKEKFLAAGLTDYISKPFTNTELINALDKALSKKKE